MLRLSALFLPLALVLVVSGCDSAGDVVDPATASVYENLPDVDVTDLGAYQDERRELLARLDALIGRAEARDASSCTLLPVGEKACGGPVAYRVYGGSSSSAAEILSIGRRLVALDRAANARLGLGSTCDVTLAPTVRYEAGRCVAAAE